MKTFRLLGGSLVLLTLAMGLSCALASPITILPTGSVWRYSASGTDLGTTWRGASFDDSTWPSGPAQLGFGDGDEATVLQPGILTAYFRRSFQYQAGVTTSLTLRLLRDDGAVVYINGVEVFRSNMPPGPVSYNTLATAAVGGAEETTQFITTSIDPSVLVQGLNLVAVEVHQVNATSSDLSFDLELIGESGPSFPVVNVVATDSDAAESGLLTALFPGRFTFYRNPVGTNILVVNYFLSGSAANGTDYRYISNQVRFLSGQAETHVDVFPLNDDLIEGTENVVLTLSPPPCAFIDPPPPECFSPGPSNRAEIFIKDASGPANQRPYVQLNEPHDGDVFNAPTNIVFRGFAHDQEDGNNISVEFLANGSSIGFGTFVPALCPAPYCPYFALVWSNPPPGNYTLVARATDTSGASSNSGPVNIIVRSTDTGTNVLVAFGLVWKYLDNGTDQGTAWRGPAFDDSSWAAGPAQLGYGDGDEMTTVGFGPDPANKYITTYFRRSFNVVNAASISALRGRLLQDDGGAVYLNGIEVFRSNLSSGPIAYDTLAVVVSPDNQVVEFTASPALLHDGRNVIAVEMHQNSVLSSDISFDLELIGQGGTPPPELPIVTVVATDSDAAESGVLAAIFSGTLTFSRTGSPSNALTAFFTLNGSAQNGIDYRYVSNSVRFNPGQAQARVDILPLNDNLVEGTENVVLTLQEPACAAIVPPPPGCYRVGVANRAEVFIRDANRPPENKPPYVQLNEPRNGDVFTAPTNIILRAYADDPEDANNVTVEFLANGNNIGFGTFVPTLCPAPYCPYFALVWSNPPPGNYTLIARATDHGGASSNSAPVNIRVREPDNHELHIVGIYAAASTVAHQEGRATVFVDRPGKLVTLFLSAYEPVLWSIGASVGTTIERIYLIGYYPGHVEAIGPDVEVIREWYNYFIGSSLESGLFYRMAPKVRRLTGLEISSFHGDSTDVVIDSVQNDPRLRSDYPVPTPLSELPDLRFTISFGGGATVYDFDYTLAGRTDGGGLHSPGERALRGNDGKYYTLGDEALLQIDPVTATSREVPFPSTPPQVSVAVGIAYDSQRDRVLLATLGGEGFLYAYSPAQDHWSVLSSMNDVDLATLTYHGYDDALYGVRWTQADAGQVTLYRFTPNGVRSGEFQLPLYPWGVDMNSSQLVSAGQYLVLLLSPSGNTGDMNREDEESRMYLIDPATGKAWLTVRQAMTISPDQPPRVWITTPTNGAVFPESASIQITAVAEGTTSYATKVEFFANGLKIGETMIGPETGGNVFRFTWQNVPAGAYTLTAKATDFRDGVGTSAPVNIRVGAVPPPVCACAAPWRNHGEYVTCVIRNAWARYRAGEIIEAQRRDMIHDAVLSDCGKHPPQLERTCIHLLPLTREECCREGMQFVLSGDAAGPCDLECSEDLVTWRTIAPVSITGWEIGCPVETGAKARFYRVRADH